MPLNSNTLCDQKEYQMESRSGVKESTRVSAPVVPSTLSANIFTAPGKAMVGERPKPFGPRVDRI